MIDENGELIDGDQLLYIVATARKKSGKLKGPVVGTVMSNLGLEHALRAKDIEFRRANVGDRYVLETLKQTGGIIGGETSGHMIVLDRTTTGDGLVCSLQVLAVMQESGRKLSELAAGMKKYPQKMVNVRIARKMNPDDSPAIQKAVVEAQGELADTGRIVLRASGTEQVIRVMVEGQDEQVVDDLAQRLAAVVAEASE
jgi:phosphoglucosamine mutase